MVSTTRLHFSRHLAPVPLSQLLGRKQHSQATSPGVQRTPPAAAAAAAAAASSSTQQRQQYMQQGAQQQRAEQEPIPGCSGIAYTAYEGNSWLATFKTTGLSVLADPWLVGDLVFAGQTWLYRGSKGKTAGIDVDAVAGQTDVILLSQGLDDHAHKPTLQRLPKALPVVGSPSAAAVARGLGFTQVHELHHGQTLHLFDGRLAFTGVPGALVGPPWSKRELGVVVREQKGCSLFFEPHCDMQREAMQSVGHADILVTPAVNQTLIAFPLVKGNTQNLVELVQWLTPRVVIPLINADFKQAGPLSWLIRPEGVVDRLEHRLQQAGLPDTRVQMPAPPGMFLDVHL